jgi:fused signal recognition particle receptor
MVIEGAIVGLVAVSVLAAAYLYRKKRFPAPEIKVLNKESENTGSKPILPESALQFTSQASSQAALSKTRSFFQNSWDKLFTNSQTEAFFSDLEEVLFTADLGVQMTEYLISELKKTYTLNPPTREQFKSLLREKMLLKLNEAQAQRRDLSFAQKPHVLFIIGINGAGKTTTIAKLCSLYKSQSKSILVGAADTFRAAATDQLKAWVERVGVQGVFQKEGADPSAVVFDSVQAAKSRDIDLCIIDTAGRLHTKSNLMEELKKMKRVADKAMPGAPHDIWLVLDGTIGQNSLFQAREFHEALQVNGLIVTKLDGSAKGGAVLGIASELKVPVQFLGTGEKLEDLEVFNSEQYIDSILGGI